VDDPLPPIPWSSLIDFATFFVWFFTVISAWTS
jgi:hypothetical protein